MKNSNSLSNNKNLIINKEHQRNSSEQKEAERVAALKLAAEREISEKAATRAAELEA